LTDVFFLVACRDDKTHLRVLARIARLLLRDNFLAEIRAAETPADSLRIIRDAESQLLAHS
jgi:PTS system nitrogen regulatory IIA component